jgi:hypothetical protein
MREGNYLRCHLGQAHLSVLPLLLSTLVSRDFEQFPDGAPISFHTASIAGGAEIKFNHLLICPGIG